MYIYDFLIAEKKNLITQSKNNIKTNFHVNNKFTYKSEISNICYRPSFTSRIETVDNNFIQKRKKLKNFIKNYLKKNGNFEDLARVDEILEIANKDNINLISKYARRFCCIEELRNFQYVNNDNLPVLKLLLMDENNNFVKRFRAEEAEIIQGTKPENVEFVEKLIKNKTYSTLFQKSVLSAIDSNNIEIASYVLDNPEINIFKYDYPKFLRKYSEDRLAAFAFLCNKTLKNNLPFPIKIVKEFPEICDDKNLPFMRKLYEYSKTNYDTKIIEEINSDNIQLAKELLSYKDKRSIFHHNKLAPSIKIPRDTQDKFSNISVILHNTTSQNQKFIKWLLDKYQNNSLSLNLSIIRRLKGCSSDELDKITKLPSSLLSKYFFICTNFSCKTNRFLINRDIEKIFSHLERLQKTVKLHPDLYVNDEEEDDEEVGEKENEQDIVKAFFEDNYPYLFLIFGLFDKDVVDNLMRRRFDAVETYFDILKEDIPESQYGLIYQFNNSCNIDGKPFLPSQKVGFIDLLKAYNDNEISIQKMEKMLERGKVDLSELHYDLLKEIFRIFELADIDEIDDLHKEKLLAWNTKYIHLISPHLNNELESLDFNLLFLLANKGVFKERIMAPELDENVNLKIKDMFTKLGYSFEKWLTPPEDLNVHMKSEDKNIKELDKISKDIEVNIDNLLKTPAAAFINKQLGKYFINDKFVIPENIRQNKHLLQDYTQNILKRLHNVWEKAESNIDNPPKKQSAKYTLNIKKSIEGQLDSIKQIDDSINKNQYDLTIKMWDRIPQKDLFQGNYTDCCIGMGESNGVAMPTYLMNTTFNMIEIINNDNGEVIGNALCYLMLDETNKPAFVIDNIEIKNSLAGSDFKKKIREGITKYAQNVAKAVTNSDTVKVYLGTHYNDVPVDDLDIIDCKFSLVGDLEDEDAVALAENSVYMDLYDGWCNSEDINLDYTSVYCLG